MEFFDWIIALCNTGKEAHSGYELSLQNQETFAAAGVAQSSVPIVLVFDIMMDGIPEEQQVVANMRDNCRVRDNDRNCAILSRSLALCLVLNSTSITLVAMKRSSGSLTSLAQNIDTWLTGGYHKSLLTYHYQFCRTFEEQHKRL
jgi:hypothetical protein